MKVLQIQNNYNFNSKNSINPNFKSNVVTKNVATKNLGLTTNGFIGKLEVVKANGKKALLNLVKSIYNDYEIYNLTDDYDRTIGRIEFRFNKSPWKTNKEKDHVFVSELRNFSNPNTPYYKNGLEEYKQIGTKLLQLAYKRSIENNCDGNIELVAKNHKEVLEFYKKLGFKQPENISIYENPYRLSLSTDAMESFANKYGGLKIL